nr:hypothetical protein [uncultured Undibacterium sp.]
MFRSLCLVLCCTLIAGCSGDIATADGTGGRLLEYKGGNIVLERTLTSDEAKDATNWLKEHGKNWSRDFVTYAPDVLAYLDHADGTSFGLYVFPQSVVFVSRGSQLKKKFAESETRKLVSLLGLGTES